MDFILAILVLALALLALAYPLYRARTQPQFVSSATLDDLLAERDGVYATLRDLELDKQLGKLDDADYTALHDKYMVQANQIVKEIDVLRGQGSGEQASVEIEQEVAALRGKNTKPKTRTKNATSVDKPSASTTADKKPAELQCPNCGRPYHQGDKFCARCGRALS